jgi:hypothetical protein
MTTLAMTIGISSAGAPERALLKGDGDFAAFHAGNIQVWATGTGGHHGAYLALQDDGNLVVYDLYGNAIWGGEILEGSRSQPYLFRHRHRRSRAARRDTFSGNYQCHRRD